MSVLINFKICDNAEECSGIAACKTGALSWDDKNKTIKIDNSKCISCDLCESSCMVHAIKVTKTTEEYEKYKEEIEQDQRKMSDLYLDRYGAQPIIPAFFIKEDKFDQEILKSHKPVVVELFNDESIMCMLRSIPIKELFKDIEIKYCKVEASDKLKNKYGIKQFPALLFFREGKSLGKIEGYFENSANEKLKNKIAKILAN